MKTESNDIINAFEETDGTGGHYHTHMGLTKREMFAAMAMQGYISAAPDKSHEFVAKEAMIYADELIKALNS